MNKFIELTDSEIDLIGYCLCVTRGKIYDLLLDHRIILASSCKDDFEEKLKNIKIVLSKVEYKDFLGV